MSVRATSNRLILLNITNMDDCGGELTVEKPSCGDNGLRDVKGVKMDETPAATETPVSRSAGRSTDSGDRGNFDGDVFKSLIRRSAKFESGSGSGDQDGSQMDDSVDIAAKKRKTRRGKPKHKKLKPYSKQQMSYQQRQRCRAAARQTKTGRQPPAPYNTTQFLMEDHSDLPDLDQKLSSASGAEVPAAFQKPSAPPRTRDSSFSIDSDEEYFYSSPEDEEEFLTKEFSSAYEDLHAERLGALTKPELIQEYVQLEAKVDLLTKRLRGKNFHQMEEWSAESKNGPAATAATTESEMAKKLKICQQRIDDLMQQNEQLRRENEALRAERRDDAVSTTDSESDDDSTSNGNRSRCSCSRRSPNSSPAPMAAYQARREKSQKRSSPTTSVDSESDSASSNSNNSSCSCPGGSPNPPKSPAEFINGFAANHEVDSRHRIDVDSPMIGVELPPAT